jgi:hypothetical protein
MAFDLGEESVYLGVLTLHAGGTPGPAERPKQSVAEASTP